MQDSALNSALVLNKKCDEYLAIFILTISVLDKFSLSLTCICIRRYFGYCILVCKIIHLKQLTNLKKKCRNQRSTAYSACNMLTSVTG